MCHEKVNKDLFADLALHQLFAKVLPLQNREREIKKRSAVVVFDEYAFHMCVVVVIS